MSLPHVLLGLLLDAPKTGYDLTSRIHSELDPSWSAGFSQIYPELSRLRRRGWVLLRVMGPRRGPRRNLYRVTAAGRRELARWLGETPPPPRSNDGFLVRLALYDGLPAGERSRALRAAEGVLAEEVRRIGALPMPGGYPSLARRAAVERLRSLRRFLEAARAPASRPRPRRGGTGRR